MYVELNSSFNYIKYHDDLNNVAPENKNFVIEITEQLYEELQNKKPWKMNNIINKIYDIQDLSEFVEIVNVKGPTETETLRDYLLDVDYRLVMMELGL